MFRATASSASNGVVLKLEGWLSGDVVGEMESCWRTALRAREGERVFVDLSELYFVDPGGRQLLTDMYRAGVTFVTRGCEMPELVREICSATRDGRRDHAVSNR